MVDSRLNKARIFKSGHPNCIVGSVLGNEQFIEQHAKNKTISWLNTYLILELSHYLFTTGHVRNRYVNIFDKFQTNCHKKFKLHSGDITRFFPVLAGSCHMLRTKIVVVG